MAHPVSVQTEQVPLSDLDENASPDRSIDSSHTWILTFFS